MYCSLASVTASCACTTSMLLATPAANRSRACVSCCAASSRAARRDLSCSLPVCRSRNGVADVVVDRALQVVGLGAPPPQIGLGFEQPALRAAALEDRDVDGAGDGVGAVASATRQAEVAVVGVDAHRRQRFADRRLARGFGGLDPLERGQIVGPRRCRRARAPASSVISGICTGGSSVASVNACPSGRPISRAS